jgi:hypothetical protein
MTGAEANGLAEKLKGLLPKMTDDQVLAVAQKLDTFPLSVGQRAVHSYAEQNDEFVLSRFMLALREAKARAQDVPRPQQHQYRYCDSLRKDMLAKGLKDAGKWSEAEVIMRWGRAWFVKQGGFHKDAKTGVIENRCRPGHQRHIAAEVARTLHFELKFAEDVAQRLAAACFESRDFFEQAIDEIKAGTVASVPEDAEPAMA